MKLYGEYFEAYLLHLAGGDIHVLHYYYKKKKKSISFEMKLYGEYFEAYLLHLAGGDIHVLHLGVGVLEVHHDGRQGR